MYYSSVTSLLWPNLVFFSTFFFSLTLCHTLLKKVRQLLGSATDCQRKLVEGNSNRVLDLSVVCPAAGGEYAVLHTPQPSRERYITNSCYWSNWMVTIKKITGRVFCSSETLCNFSTLLWKGTVLSRVQQMRTSSSALVQAEKPVSGHEITSF